MRAAVVLVGLSAVLSLLLSAASAPSPTLFGPLIAGAFLALSGRLSTSAPAAALTLSQAAVGVTIGTYVQTSTLRAVGAHWAPVLLVTVATLGLSLASGLVLARVRDVDRATASFSMLAGGASGLAAASRQLGADERLVAVIQYLRVLIVVLVTPVVAVAVFPAGQTAAGPAATGTAPASGLAALAFVAVCVVGGLLLARAAPLPAGSLLGPLVVSAALTLARLPAGAHVPAALQDLAFAVIGVQIGLRFTRASLRSAGRILPMALALLTVVGVICAGLGMLLATLTGVRPLDGYLATTPGGLYVVLATAATTHSDTTFVLAVQVLRLVVMLLAAPVLSRRLRQTPGRALSTRG